MTVDSGKNAAVAGPRLQGGTQGCEVGGLERPHRIRRIRQLCGVRVHDVRAGRIARPIGISTPRHSEPKGLIQIVVRKQAL